MPNLAKRSLTSMTWRALANGLGMVVLFFRSIILTRLLPVDTFGAYGFATAIVASTGILTTLGMGAAFVHRHAETLDEAHIAAVHFTLKCITTLAWALLLLGATVWWTEAGELRTALLLLIAIDSLGHLFLQTPRLLLTRRIVHRRLALIEVTNIFLGTAVALILVSQGATLWALLSVHIVHLLSHIVLFYLWEPVWKPQLKWSPSTVRYLLSFGIRTFLANLLLKALDRLDDLWTGFYLGEVPMGYYSRAYRYATYPRYVLAAPLNRVIMGTYAELQGNRLRLSQAFFRTNALLVRTGFFAAGLLTLMAPEFIRLLLTDKWLPMLEAFRLMLAFTLLDPIRATTSNLFIAVGKPATLIRIRFIQLCVLLGGLFTFGSVWGIAGVALAVTATSGVGITLLLWQAKTEVDFSTRRLFSVPSLALGAGFLLTLLGSYRIAAAGDLISVLVKTVCFSAGYGIILLVFEYRVMRDMIVSAWDTVRE